MHRFYVPGKWAVGQRVSLGAQESHHALRVLRLRPGDPVQLLNGRGELGEAVLGDVEGRQVSAVINDIRARPRGPLEITLVVGLPKPRAMDLVIQKGAELGVSHVCVVCCERSVSQSDVQELAEKAEKWRAAAIETLKQCGGFWLPRIDVFSSMAACLERAERTESRWVAALTGSPKHPREWLDRMIRETDRFPQSIEVWIGPEGDFSGDEMALLLSHGALPVSLGDNTLRSETAALYCACVLLYEATSRVALPLNEAKDR